MRNVESVPDCPRCKTRGQVLKGEGMYLTMFCPQCKSKWNTLSEICPDCKQPNRYPGPGSCKKCYGLRKEILDRNEERKKSYPTAAVNYS